MYETTKLPYGHPMVKKLVGLTFPTYRGRKITLVRTDRPVSVTSYWDGGSRSYFVAIDLRTMRTAAVPQNGTIFDGGPIAPDGIIVPPGCAIVEHSIFQGRDTGLRVYVAPNTTLPMPALPAPALPAAH